METDPLAPAAAPPSPPFPPPPAPEALNPSVPVSAQTVGGPASIPNPGNLAHEASEIRLGETQHAKLASLLWRKRALYYKSREIEGMLGRAIEEAKHADLDFLRFARSLGIDVKRVFDISDSGVVTYPASPASVEPPKSK